MKRLINAVAGGTLAAVLVACAGPVIYFQDYNPAYRRNEASAGAGGALWVEVIGRPSGAGRLDAGQIATLIARGMQENGPHWFSTTFVTEATAAENSRYRVRVLFGPPKGLTIQRACSPGIASAESESAGMIVAFCRGDRFLGTLRGSIDGVTPGPDDSAAFRRAMGFAARIVLSPVNPELGPDCTDPLNCI